jgi:hypothetical protein
MQERRGAGWYVFAIESGVPRQLRNAEEEIVNRFRFGPRDSTEIRRLFEKRTDKKNGPPGISTRREKIKTTTHKEPESVRAPSSACGQASLFRGIPLFLGLSCVRVSFDRNFNFCAFFQGRGLRQVSFPDSSCSVFSTRISL